MTETLSPFILPFVRITQKEADALIRLYRNGKPFNTTDFANALGVRYGRAEKFLRNAWDRALVTVTKDGKIWRRK